MCLNMALWETTYHIHLLKITMKIMLRVSEMNMAIIPDSVW